MTATQFASLDTRVRRLDRLFRWGLELLPGTAIGRPLLRQLIGAYEETDDEGRRRLRKLMAECEAFAANAGLPGAATDSPETFRDYLLWFSLIHEGSDSRDSLLWLKDLCRDGQAARIAIEPLLREVAEMSGDTGGAPWSAKAMLLAEADAAGDVTPRAAQAPD